MCPTQASNLSVVEGTLSKWETYAWRFTDLNRDCVDVMSQGFRLRASKRICLYVFLSFKVKLKCIFIQISFHSARCFITIDLAAHEITPF